MVESQSSRTPMQTIEDGEVLPSGGMPDTGPFAATPARGVDPNASAVGEIAVPVDHEAMRVRAVVEARLLGEHHAASAVVGRFQLLERVGEGGMGVVWAAYDPQLDRKVAVKLLRREQGDASLRRRILREAQSMARLSHPNVAQVFEVGEYRGQTFVALEFVRGQTLRAWQKQGTYSWPQIVAAYVQAGRGLAAAHDVGLVHRDFKPDNAMLGDDGRVRVLDFGLARVGEGITARDLHLDTLLPSPGEDALGTPLTRDGAVMGTPAYMAPEQLLGEATDARTDQFGFCVALWEALYGERPFAGASRAELIGNVTRGRIRSVPRHTKVPTWIRAVLERGLAVAPSQRHPSMNELLAALSNDPTRRKRRRIAAGATVAVLAVGAAAVEGLRRHDAAARVAACDEAGARIDEIWNPDVRAQVSERILGSGLSYAPTTIEKLVPRLDAAAAAWRTHATDACASTTVHRTWSERTFDRAAWCLDERRLELDALVDQLAEADGDIVRSAIDAVAGLTSVAACTDAAALESLPAPPDAAVREAIAPVRAELARANALRSAGKPAAALALAKTTADEAETLAWPPLVAAAQLTRARALVDTTPTQAEAAMTSAYVYAAKAGVWDVADRAATDLIALVGHTLQRHAEGRSWASHAEVAASRAGDPTGLREASRMHNLAIVRFAEGEYAAALELHGRVLAIEQSALGEDHPGLAATLSTIAIVHLARGEHASAAPLLARALTLEESSYGPDHPAVAGVLTSLLDLELATGSLEAAREHGERALAIYEQALGPDHALVGLALANLAQVHNLGGDPERGLTLAQRSLAIRERSLGRTHPGVADSLEHVGNAYLMRGEPTKAREQFEHALVIREQTLGADHPAVARLLNNLAHLRRQTGDLVGARSSWERALAIDEAAQGPTSMNLSYPLIGLARVASAQARHAEAVALAQRALDLRAAAGARGSLLGEAQFVLGSVSWEASAPSSDGRERALVLARAAAESFRDQPGGQDAIAEIEAWLDARGAAH
ncbi:MAG: serine/threonine-protein kinase [Nannocystaceae bacterium]|nr:serine/threonine-protein kinase [Nannocystaceae bacterium]